MDKRHPLAFVCLMAALCLCCAKGITDTPSDTSADAGPPVRDAGGPDVPKAPDPVADAAPPPRGSIFVQTEDLNMTKRIVLAGTGAWEKASTYTLIYLDEGQSALTGLTVSQPWHGPGYGVASLYGDIAVLIRTAENPEGCVVRGTLGDDLTKTFDASSCHVTLAAFKAARVLVFAKVPVIGPSDSGSILGLGLSAVASTNADADFDGFPTPQLVLRKSMPIIEQASVASTTLADADMDLLCADLSADQAGPIALKQLVVHVTHGAGITVSNIGLRKDGVDLDASLLAITDDKGHDLLTGGSDALDATIAIAFRDGKEERISETRRYCIHGTITGSINGSSLKIELLAPEWRTSTGVLATDLGLTPFPPLPEVFGIAASQGKTPALDAFLWSDLSGGTTHSAATGQNGGSRDWANGDLIPGSYFLTQSFWR